VGDSRLRVVLSRKTKVAIPTAAAAMPAAQTTHGDAKSPLVLAAAIQANPQTIANAGAMQPREYNAITIPTTTTIASTPTVAHCHPGNVPTPAEATNAAALAVVATQTQPKYSPNVPLETSASIHDTGGIRSTS